MNNQKHKRNKFLFIISLIITVIALLICLALMPIQLHLRFVFLHVLRSQYFVSVSLFPCA